jgi:hypothetical protein
MKKEVLFVFVPCKTSLPFIMQELPFFEIFRAEIEFQKT